MYLFTGANITKNIPDRSGVEKIIVVNIINDKAGMKKALSPVLEKAFLEGKIKKR